MSQAKRSARSAARASTSGSPSANKSSPHTTPFSQCSAMPSSRNSDEDQTILRADQGLLPKTDWPDDPNPKCPAPESILNIDVSVASQRISIARLSRQL